MVIMSFRKYIFFPIFYFFAFFSVLIFFTFTFIPLASAESASLTFTPNEIGRIPVMEYHDVASKESSFVRSYDNFRHDLEFFYNNDYALITVRDFIDQDFDVPAGKKPLIFTFDDSRQSQFNVLDDGTIDPESVIGIMDSFFQAHPDFGRNAIFYMLQYPFGQPQYFIPKLQYLLKTGREMGNHTLDHDSLAKMTTDDIQRNLAGLQGKIQGFAGTSFSMNSLAYPYGAVPKGDDIRFVEKGENGGVKYEITTGFLVGADPTYPPYGVKFDPLRIPRIQADDTEFQRWFARLPGSTARVDEEFRPFISDGNKETVSVLESDFSKLDRNRLRSGLILVKSAPIASVGSRMLVAGWEKKAVMSKIDVFVNEGDLSKADNVLNVSSDSLKPSENTVGADSFEGGNLGLDNFSNAHVLNFGWTQAVLDASWNAKKMFSFFEPIEDAFQQLKRSVLSFEIQNLPENLVFQNDGFYYTVQDGDTLSSIASTFLPYTSYYLKQEFLAMLTENLGKETLKKGFLLKIPGVEKIIFPSVPSVPNKLGIYWTGYTAGSSRALDLLGDLVKAGGTMVVFDLKETAGEIFYDTQVPLAREIGAISLRLPDVKKLVRVLHRKGVYAVARLTMFKDVILAQSKPEFAIKSKSTGKPFTSGEVREWVDPSNPDVQAYNIDIAKEVASLGVDEIQFDYIRFPTLGSAPDVDYYYYRDNPNAPKYEIIAAFLKKARDALEPYGVKLGIDVYGIIAWSDGDDAKATGQKVDLMAEYVDTIYPMIYPSHFGPGFGGHKNPADEPYFFIQESAKKFKALVKDKADIVPWLQGFPYRTSNFGVSYVQSQIQALRDLNMYSFVIWSAANKYDVSFPAF